MSGLHANFITNPSGMAASLPGELVFGMPGESGGYYTIDVTQPNDTTMRLTFTPSQSTMAPIPAADIILPHGPKGDPGQADAQQVHALVEEYLAKNPPKITESDPTVPQWAKAKDKPSYTAVEVGAVSTDALPDAIDEALAQAKESGEFDGITPEFTIGTVNTLDAGSNATASISGTKENPVLNLGIPQGLPGEGGTGGASNFPTLIDNITIEEEGVKEITLAIDLTICKEARFYISVPANNAGKTINYYVSTNNAYQGYNQGWLTSYTNIATGTTVYYKGITDTLGDFSYATGFQGANVDRPGDPGGSGTVTAAKSPRLVSKVTKLIWTDAETTFPVGTRVQTYMWG